MRRDRRKIDPKSLIAVIVFVGGLIGTAYVGLDDLGELQEDVAKLTETVTKFRDEGGGRFTRDQGDALHRQIENVSTRVTVLESQQ